MAMLSRDGTVQLGAVLFLVVASVLALAAAPGAAQSSLPCRDGGDHCIGIGFTDAWFNGQTVQLEYSHRFFCAEPPRTDAPSGCEAGQAATTNPPSGPVVSNVYLLIPVGFSPPASTLHCPICSAADPNSIWNASLTVRLVALARPRLATGSAATDHHGASDPSPARIDPPLTAARSARARFQRAPIPFGLRTGGAPKSLAECRFRPRASQSRRPAERRPLDDASFASTSSTT